MLAEIDRLKDRFDVIIFDCPPGISAFTETVLKASDIIVVPVIPDVFSTLGLQAFCHRVLAESRGDMGDRRLPWVLANRVTNSGVAVQKLKEMRAEAEADDAGFRMFQTEIPHMPALIAAMDNVDGAPTYANKYGDARDKLMELAREVIGAINAT
jgi:cellulose biosynthesis protein BcsQ